MSTQRARMLGLMIVAALAVAACGGSGTTQAPGGYGYGSGPTAAPSAAPSTAPGTTGATVEFKAAGSAGTVLVAGSNGMTVYTFDKDVANSGTSACTGDCLARWPALTVASGTAPVAGAGVSGTLGTITRADDGALQVTYNGLPLYFFAGDTKPGDTNGNYTGWRLVTP
jgi:predicted lipoprotein with Yx(FWY)xxD motif